MTHLWGLFLLVFAVSGCTTVHGPDIKSHELETAKAELDLKAYKYHLKLSERVDRIGYNLVRHVPDEYNLSKPRPFIGFFGVEPGFLSNRHFNHNPAHGVYLAYVLEDTPLAQAGLQAGDILQKINDQDVDTEAQALRVIRENGFEPLALEMRRGGHMFNVTVQPEALKVNVEFDVEPNADINALTTPTKITLQYGILNFIRTEEELAVILAHELAHIVRRHTDSIPVIFMAGMLANKLTKDLERDADFYSLIFLKAAGYDPQQAVSFYERIAIQLPETRKGGLLYTHPGMTERSLRVRKALEGNLPFK